MRKKISRRFIIIALFSIVITTLVMTMLFYALLKKQVFSDLKDMAQLIITEDSFEYEADNIRITLIEPDGTVSYDSLTDAALLENHLNRPEVSEAVKNGSGEAERMSNTLSESVFYYAQRLDDGSVLRIAKEANSVISLLASTLPIVIGVLIILMVICFILSRYLTSDIIKPIDEMANDMEHTSPGNIYPELAPFAQKIKTQHEEILATANIRQEFTANVSHELKTPLTVISGYAELIGSGMVNDEDTKHFALEIRKSAARLLTLINDIINLSSLDAIDVNAEKEFEQTDIAQIASESAEMLSYKAAKNNVTVIYTGVKSAKIRISKEMAQDLVFNLLENAVKYNKKGGSVLVEVEKEADKVIFTVKDTGIGIPPEHHQRVFERFYRVDKSRSKELGGTGLGLAIVKHICTISNGDITLKSEAQEGTEIKIIWKA